MKKYTTYYLILVCIWLTVILIWTLLISFILWEIPDFKNINIEWWVFARILLLVLNIPTICLYFLMNDPDKNI